MFTEEIRIRNQVNEILNNTFIKTAHPKRYHFKSTQKTLILMYTRKKAGPMKLNIIQHLQKMHLDHATSTSAEQHLQNK